MVMDVNLIRVTIHVTKKVLQLIIIAKETFIGMVTVLVTISFS